MISVVIPTMWYFEPFVEYLYDLSQLECIDQIIIIDNNPSARPVDNVVFYNPKIEIISFDTNIGVNPAWNAGVAKAKNNKVCIINDDIILDLKLFYRLNHIVSPFGFIGLTLGEEKFKQPEFKTGSIKITKFNPAEAFPGSLLGLGTCFMVDKSRWVDIPNDLVYYFGDDWVVRTQMDIDDNNYIIYDCLYYTPGHATCGKVLGDREADVFNAEMIIYKTYMFMATLQKEYKQACAINSDIYAHLPRINELLKECSSAVEMGVRDGWSTRAFLINQHLKLRSYDLYLDERVKGLFNIAVGLGMDAQYIQASTLNISIDPCDLLFIDTEHNYTQLSKELELHGNKANKYLVFHDTVTFGTELMPAIFEFMGYNPHWQIKNHYADCNGLTILERIS